jgi:hypothetical protein
MTNSKLLNFAVVALALVSSIAIDAQVASAADGPACGNWSFNDPSCSAYINPSGMQAEVSAKTHVEAANCGNWSFNDPSCSAYIKPSEMKAETGTFGSDNAKVCSLGNFNANHC